LFQKGNKSISKHYNMRKIFHLLNLFVVLGILPLSAQFTLNLPSTTANCGDLLQLPITVENFDSLTSIQFSINWDAAVLSFEEGQLAVKGELNTNLSENGALIFKWEEVAGLSLQDGDTLMVLSLFVTTNAVTKSTIQFGTSNIISVNGAINDSAILNEGMISVQGSTGPPVSTNCLDTVYQYTTPTTCEVVGEWAVPEFQACSGDVVVETSHELGTSLGIGSRTITYTATDEAGRSNTCSFVHIVQDTIAPVISNCPENFEVNFSTDAGCDLSVTWSAPSFLERCSSTETMVSSNFNSGDNFPVGNTIVTYEATDFSGNKSTCSFEVIVTGSDPITFDRRPENIVIPAMQGQCGATYDWSLPTAISGCAPVTLIANFEQGSFFPVGTTVVEYIATDQINQRAVWAFSVSVEDDQPMVVRCPTDIIIEANGQVESDDLSFVQDVSSNDCGPYQLELQDIEIIDNCASSITRSLVSGSNSEFPVGKTQMEYLIENEAGETSSCAFEITILEAPPISISRSEELACVDSDYPLMAVADKEDYYDAWEWEGPNDFQSFEKNPLVPLTKESAGIYQVTASSSSTGCSTSAMTEIQVFGLAGAPTIESDQVIICEGESFSFSTLGVDGATFEWQGPNEFSSNELSIDFQDAQSQLTGDYTLTRTFEGCASPSANVRVIVLSEIIANDDVINTFVNNSVAFEVLSNDTLALDAPFTVTTLTDPEGNLVSEMDGTFIYSPKEGFIGVDQFAYEICYDACPDLCGSGLLTIRTSSSDEICSYPTFLSPNGDEDNETLQFSCNDADSGNATGGITIFNQYGAIVYQSYPYRNDWQGTYKGEPLPDGTYYYIYKATADDPEPIKNCVTIFR